MSGIYLVIFIIFIIYRISSSSKKVKTNRPGQRSAAPTLGSSPMRDRAAMPAQPQPPKAPEPVLDMSSAAAPDYGMLDDSDRARDDLAEGDSRECDHGSVGGSMDITTHMGTGDEFEHARQQVETRVKVNVKPSRTAQEETAATARAIPELSAEEMRRAIVMAEILKRPAERYAGRRWAAR